MSRVPASDVNWTRSSSCVGGDCVEVARVGDRVLVRDSKLGADSPVISLSSEQWVHALGRVVSGGYPMGTFRFFADGSFDLVSIDWGGLRFTAAEWNAFAADVKAGKFDYSNLSELSAASLPDATAADEAAGRSGHRAAAEGAGEGALPAPSPASHVVAALVDLCRPEWLPWEQPVSDEADAWGREWATDAFAAGLTAAEGLARKQAGELNDVLPQWGTGPLVKHVPTDSPVAMPGETVVVSCSAAATGGLTARTEGNGEVAPVGLEDLAGATEPNRGEVAPEAIGVSQSTGATEPEGCPEPADGWCDCAGHRRLRAALAERERCITTTHIGPCGPGCIWHARHVAS